MRIFFLFYIYFFSFHIIASAKISSVSSYVFQEKNQTFIIKGSVFNASNNSPIVGALITVKGTNLGSVTDSEGKFRLSLDYGQYTLVVSSIGKLTVVKELTVSNDSNIDFYLKDDVVELSEVTVNSSRETDNILSTSMGMEKLSIEKIKKMPAFLGELDVINSVLTLPGVSSVGEASGGFNVRGGSIGQNLVLFDGAPIFYTSHLFGFFSVFNQDVINDVTLYKGGSPARYGGRVSSILEVESKSAIVNEFSAQGGISLVSGRFSAHIPIIKNKLGVTLSARSTYSDFLLNSAQSSLLSNSSASFYDLNGKISFKISDSDILTATYYRGLDNFSFSSDTLYSYGNDAMTLKYTNILSENLDFNVTAIYSKYASGIEGIARTKEYDFNVSTEVLSGNYLMAYSANRHNIEIGLNSSLYELNPGSLSSASINSIIDEVQLDKERGLELAVFLSDELSYDKWGAEFGLRYSYFMKLGPGNTYLYDEFSDVADTLRYNRNQVMADFGGLEPRLSLSYIIAADQSMKFGYQRMRQYLNLLANNVSMVPTDIYKVSNSYIKPQIVDQLSIGYFRNFSKGLFETSFELYYKDMQNVIDFKDGAELLLNNSLETQLLNAKGYSYGLEVSFVKTRGDFTGQLNYTYSRALIKDISTNTAMKVNKGKYFPTFYDRPHAISSVLSYKLSDKASLNANFTYSTGRPITIPISKYDLETVTVAEFSERNQFRTPDFHRLDISLKIESDRKKETKWKGSWVFGVYNLYGRKNPFSVFFRDYNNAPPQLYKLSIIGTPFPSISYNFEF